MHNRNLTLLLLLIVAAYFTGYFVVLHAVTGKEAGISELIDRVKYEIEHNRWNEAQAEYSQLKTEWNNTEYLIRLNYAEEDYSDFETALYHLGASIAGKDRTGALRESQTVQLLWSSFVSIIPEP